MIYNFPYTLTIYLSKEFLKCLFVILLVFTSITLLVNFVEELIFFKEKNIDNFILLTVMLTLCKTPNTLIETTIFIFLFSGILFFVKFQKNSEINTIKLSGIKNSYVVLVPAILSLFLGVFIVFLGSPLSSEMLKIYENNKRIYSKNDNLIVINDSGLWFMENNNNKFIIIRSDKILNNDFSKLYNSTIYELDEDFNFIQRYDSSQIDIDKKDWLLKNTYLVKNNFINSQKLSNNFKSLSYKSSIDIENLKSLFTNVNTVSFWEILENIKILNLRGYSGDELKIKFHKYLSLPIYLLAMIVLSTIFTININKNYSTFIYIFLGIVMGIIIYFLNDLSIALGMSNKISLAMSVWIPIFIILSVSIFNLIKINEI